MLPFALQSILAERCIESELIIIDDNSLVPVCLPNFVQEAFHSNLVLIRNTKNQGVIGARNTGILAAKGDYILFLDDDDQSFPSRTRVLYDAIHRTNYDFVAGKSLLKSPSGEKIVPPTMAHLHLTPLEWLLNPPHINSILWRRQTLLDSGGLDARIPYLGEHVTAMLWLLNGKKAFLRNETVAQFRYIENGLTISTNEQNKMKKYLTEFYEILQVSCNDIIFQDFCQKVTQMLGTTDIVDFDGYLVEIRKLTNRAM